MFLGQWVKVIIFLPLSIRFAFPELNTVPEMFLFNDAACCVPQLYYDFIQTVNLVRAGTRGSKKNRRTSASLQMRQTIN